MKSVRQLFLPLFFALLFVSQNAISQAKDNFIRLNRTFDRTSQIAEDRYGYIWITDKDGLYKYDGYNFIRTPYNKIFGEKFSNQRFIIKKDPYKNIWISNFNGDLIKIDSKNTQKSFKDFLISNRVTTIQNYDNTVWFGSNNGTVYKYNKTTETIDSITSLPKTTSFQQQIKSLVFTSKNNMWISTYQGRIYNYRIDLNTITELEGEYKSDNQNILLTKDNMGKLWIATELQGLYSYDPNHKKFESYDDAKKKGTENKYVMFISIFTDKKGIIWGGTDGDGLFRIDPYKKSISIYKHNETNIFSISDNTVLHINEDSHGNKWIITKKGELNILPSNDRNIDYYNGLSNNTPTRILCSYKASDGSLWIGTDGKGLNRVYPDGTKIHYANQEKGNTFFEGMFIQRLTEDVKGNIWIATYQNGLWVYNTDKQKFTKKALKDPKGQYAPDVRHVFRDKENRIWASSITGIHVFDQNGNQIKAFSHGSNGLYGSISQSINQDENGNIWIGVDDAGLFKFVENNTDFSKSEFIKHSYYPDKDAELYSHNIVSIHPDYSGGLWILNVSGHLTYYDINSKTGKTYTKNKSIGDIRISSFLIQDPKNLWLGSESGLHHYNAETDVVKSYRRTDGLQGNKFVLRGAYKDRNGKLYFGGNYGLSAFYPEQLNRSEGNAHIYINSIDILNKPAKEILGPELRGRIEQVQTLNLNADQTSFAFQFSAIDNILNSDYHYAYKLNGFDNEWISPKQERVASYTNIPFGSYTFEVKAGSKKGIWDIPPKKIKIRIAPPWWRSNIAYVFYIMILGCLVFAVMRWSQLRRKLAKRAWQNQKNKEIYALKMNFFAKMSHEIQTPLTLILGPIDDMLHRAGTDGNSLLMQRLSILRNNAKRLSRIANELMTVRNKELGRLKVLVSKNNLIDHLKDIAFSFSEQARFKDIEIVQKYPKDNINLWYDKDKIEHVMYNLISNAFKFTPKKGCISLNVSLLDSVVEISVSDTGPGIPKEELDNIFKLFYQSELGKHKKGLGVGLALTKEIVSMHHGDINVHSSTESGATFTVQLPTGDAVFSEDEKLMPETQQKMIEENQVVEPRLYIKTSQANKTEKKYTLLIVEDNIEMQIFLQDVLSESYNLILAENGKEGVSLTKKNKPDLIVSDIMMPVMDGIEMCKVLQDDKTTWHIPIILLTAKNSESAKIEGLGSGAIEYIYKPFNFHELLLKVENILTARAKALSKHKTDLITSPNGSSNASKDDIFLENLVKEINKELDNSNFKLEELPNSLNMSYSVIYRKCQDITGKTLVDFVRSLRLKKAAVLISEKGYNISEAAYMVGYKDPKYFTKCFKEEFGKSPSYFKKKGQKILSSLE